MVFGPWRKPSGESASATRRPSLGLQHLQRRFLRQALQAVAAEHDDALEGLRVQRVQAGGLGGEQLARRVAQRSADGSAMPKAQAAASSMPVKLEVIAKARSCVSSGSSTWARSRSSSRRASGRRPRR